MMKFLRRRLGFGFAVACGALLTGCLFHGRQTDEPTFSDSLASPAGSTNAPRTLADAVRYRIGDQVTVTFSGLPNLIPPHQERIKEDGTITLDLIGPVVATNKTPGELQKAIQDLYVPKYYAHLTVTVTSDLLFYSVGGEVNKQGPLAYVGGTTVVSAIQAAGGFTEYANKKKVRLIRSGAKKPITVNCVDAQIDPTKDLPVFPGDRIDVPRRLL